MAAPPGPVGPAGLRAAQGDPLDGHPVYEKIRTIGRGHRSFVAVARHRATGEQVAIRFIPRGWEPSHTKYVTREILNHQELSLSKHPHIVEFKEVFLTARYLAEVLEYVEGETLQVFLEKVGGKVIEGLARFIFQQLIIALDFCHRKGKVNRDIKLSNILLSIAEGQLPLVKLCDFGVSKDTYRHSEPHSQVGTALFVAPEVMQNFSGGRYDGQAADVWACGVCLFIMLFGRHPYLRPEDAKLNEQQQMIKLFQRMMQNQIEFPADLVGSLTPECNDILGRMLRTDPNKRASMVDIQRHPWFATALPEGAALMNDVFLAEESASLSPQSQSQIEALVTLAARRDELPPTTVALPSHASRIAAAASAGVPRTTNVGSSPTLPQAGGRPPLGGSATAPHPPQGMSIASGQPGGPGPGMMIGPGSGSGQYGSQQAAGGRPSLTASPTLGQRAPSGHLGYLVPDTAGLPVYPGGGPAFTTQHMPMGGGHGLHHSHSGSPTPGLPTYPGQSPPPQQQPASSGGSGSASYGGGGGAAAMATHPQAALGDMGASMGMIPDLDAMIMSMPETDLLEAATIDLRQRRRSSSKGPGAAPYPPPPPHMVGPSVGGMYGGMAPPLGAPAQPAVLQESMSGGMKRPRTQLPGMVPLQQQQQHSQQHHSQQVQQQQQHSPTLQPGYGSGSMMDVRGLEGGGGPSGGPGALRSMHVEAAPFLYEAADDDLPMVSSVSAVMPTFDWGTFNAPMLGNLDSLQASHHFQASRFTRACRDVNVKMSETGGNGGGRSHLHGGVGGPDSHQFTLEAGDQLMLGGGGHPPGLPLAFAGMDMGHGTQGYGAPPRGP